MLYFRKNIKTVLFRCLAVCGVLLCVGQSFAQVMEEHKQELLKLPFYKRISVYTNTVDWVLTTANMGVEIDLGNTEETHYSLLFTGKLNLNADHTINPRLVYNVRSASMELRKYWRTGSKTIINPLPKESERDTTVSWLVGTWRKFRHNVLSGSTYSKPRYWRAYYVGLYGALDEYSICLGKKGKQGDGVNLGLSAGWSIPLYPLRNGGGIDLDLGLVVGGKFTRNYSYEYFEESGCYGNPIFSDWHVVPYPVIHDVHVSLVYRFNSISNKVKGGAARYEKKREQMDKEREERRRKIEMRYDKRMAELKSKREESAENNK